MAVVTTRVSSRGQVVIPAEVRRQLQITEGDEMTVEVGPPPGRAIVLRPLSAADVDRLLEKGWDWLRGKEFDPVKALHRSRVRERSRERSRRP